MKLYANRLGFSDVQPYEVVKKISERTLLIRPMKAESDPSWKPIFHPGGFSAHCSNQEDQKWIISPDETAQCFRIRKLKKGDLWGFKGTKFRVQDRPVKFYDYNF